jgi:D-alanyl-D-alanine carboxypeptidase
VYLIVLIATLAAVLTACSAGSQPSDGTNTETSSGSVGSSETSDHFNLDLQFDGAVESYVQDQWGTWKLGGSMGQCLISNAGSLTKEAKQAVIEHGIEEAFDYLSGTHIDSFSKVWDLCESEAASSSISSSAKGPSPTPTRFLNNSTSDPTQALDFESTVNHQDFPEGLRVQFQTAVNKRFDASTDKAGISVAVHQGDYIWKYATGMASSSEEMSVGTPILIRSTSKTFLAGLVLQQIDEGLYSLSDTLSSLLPRNMERGAFDAHVINREVTVGQLLAMTSGIKHVTDYSRPEYSALHGSSNWKPADIVRLVIADYVPPGTYEYSNTNSILLGLIAEHAGQQQLNKLYKSQLFDPLGIVAVLLPQDAVPQNTARPHGDRSRFGGTGFGDIMEGSYHGADWYRATNRTTWAAAGMVTTPENAARWIYELLSDQGSALSPAARSKLLDSFNGPLIAIGGPIPEHRYGYHITKTTLALSNSSITAYGHPGMGAGYTSDLFYSPELDLSISLVVNSHSDARSRMEAQGQITHEILGDIAVELFEIYKAK